jgi:hypothetical protein
MMIMKRPIHNDVLVGVVQSADGMSRSSIHNDAPPSIHDEA